MREIVRYLLRMAPAALVALGAYFAVKPLRLKRLQGKHLATTAAHEIALAALFMFTAGLLWLTVLPGMAWQDGRLVFFFEGVGGINLRPFLIFEQSRILASQGKGSYFLINFWGNIAMFLPIGFLPALLWRRPRWWKALAAGAGLSLCIELCQIPIDRGTDIDDLWLNTLGALAGYALAWLLGRLWPEWAEKCKLREVSSWT